jgi:hypothetical protein
MMRKQILWNSDWLFARGDTPEKATPVTLPHTWTAAMTTTAAPAFTQRRLPPPPTVTARRSGWNLRALP